MVLFRFAFLACSLSLLLLSDSYAFTSTEDPLPSPRKTINLNSGWNYAASQEEEAIRLKDLDDQIWSTVDLPHSWNQWDATDLVPGYRRDVSWYVKDLEYQIEAGRRYFLYFEGANLITDVFVNGQKVGTHIGGYVGFRMEITEFLDLEEGNQIQVRVDNSHNLELIPSNKADFFIYGGITRDVWLEDLPTTMLTDVSVSIPEVSASRAVTNVQFRLDQPSASRYRAEVLLTEKGASEPILSSTVAVNNKKTPGTISLDPLILDQPKLWSPSNPQLYDCVIRLYEKNQLIDEVVKTIGYRWFHFEPNGPFFLNGERLLIRGTHRHEEHAGLGPAMSNELHRRDIELIKEMGANFVRLAHYPQDPEVYQACNELGLIVWDELPWCRGGVGNASWQKNTTQLLREQILQNHHHPSILFWSLGNEMYWEPDFEGGGDPKNINPFLDQLNDLAHELDPTRMTAVRKYYDGANLVDVFSPSIWSGWYAGVYKNYEQSLNSERVKYPNFLHMEYGGASHVGRHSEHPITGEGILREDQWAEVSNQVNIQNIAKSGDWSENYVVDLFDWYLSVTENLDWFAGNAQWAVKDFGTPLRPENDIPYINQKGLLDRAGNPKDAYYVFKSYWSEESFAYIESHTWTERTGPLEKEHELNVYSNSPKLELFLNSRSLGVKTRDLTDFPASGYHWMASFSEGENELIAIGFGENGEIICRDSLYVNYSATLADKPSKLILSSTKIEDGYQLIEATIVDKSGNRCLDFEDRVYFSHSGTGSLDQHMGTPTGSLSIRMANGRAAIRFRPAPEGTGTIGIRSQHFKGTFLIFEDGEVVERRSQPFLPE